MKESDELRDQAVQLADGPHLLWVPHYRRWLRFLAARGSDLRSKATADEALALLDRQIEQFNNRLPASCWWAVGSAAVFGNSLAVLPDTAELMDRVVTQLEKTA